ncbi:nucleobase-ascorbate transporter 12 [Populus alba x Populus x berolinensis]|nr:nucleobase-ascorbate transporter 12 [Populus alba x Populus x berolinensis]
MSTSDPKARPIPGKRPPAPESAAMPPSSWAKKTGFRPKFSGETNGSDSGQISLPPRPKEQRDAQPDLEAENKDQTVVKRRRDSDGGSGGAKKDGSGHGANGAGTNGPPSGPRRAAARNEEVIDVEDGGFAGGRHTHMKYELRDTPGLVPIGLYGFQHYLSMLGSLILIPLVIVPAMGGTYEDTSTVVSTVLFVSGVTTLLHTSFGSRLPLIQGPSFVYLAPALAIINSPEFQGLNGNNFKHIMKELQGAIIIASAFQTILGYSGLMSVLLRLINPVVVAPTIAAVGLSFYSYGFPRVGTCLEIGVVQILLVIMFSLYLRKISVFGHRIFLIYAVPLGLAITWAAAFLLTEAGVYSYKGCDANVPASNIISDHCRKHVSRIKHCRVDTSHALKSSPWFRFPYPLQWGTPVFEWKMALVMCAVSIISSVDSASNPGVVSRGIGLEGLCSVLAGLWGTGTGSTTITENVHTIAVTKMGSRRAVELGACALILLSLIGCFAEHSAQNVYLSGKAFVLVVLIDHNFAIRTGKVGGFIASIPEVMVAALLCFMWAMLAALGLSNLRYSEAGSSRNIIIVGLSLFFSLSVPSYFQQYGISPNTNLSVPSYLQPYIVATHGPFRSKYGGLNYFLNTVLSLNMVIAFLVAVILDNTVPGSQQERGVYVWSETEAARREPAITKDYELPFRVGRIFRWVKWVGL